MCPSSSICSCLGQYYPQNNTLMCTIAPFGQKTNMLWGGGSPWIISRLAPSRVFLPAMCNPSPKQKRSFPNTLSELTCEPATGFGPITTTQLCPFFLPPTVKCCEATVNRGLCQKKKRRGQHRPQQELQTSHSTSTHYFK